MHIFDHELHSACANEELPAGSSVTPGLAAEEDDRDWHDDNLLKRIRDLMPVNTQFSATICA